MNPAMLAAILIALSLVAILLMGNDTFYRMFRVTESDQSLINLNHN